MALTPEERRQLQAELAHLKARQAELAGNATGVRPQEPTFGERAFGEMGPDAEMKDIARALLNVPGSAWQVGKDVTGAVGGLLPLKALGVGEGNFDTIKALGSVGYGSILKGAEALLGKTEGGEEYKAAFEQFVDGLAQRYGGLQALRETAVRDPVGLLLDVSPAKAGALKMAGKAAKAFVRPVSMPLGVVQKGAQHAVGVAREGGAFVGSLATGLQPETFRVGIEAGASAPLRSRPFRAVKATDPADELTQFRKAAREQVPVAQIAQVVDDAQARIRQGKGNDFAKWSKRAEDFPSDIGKLRNGLTKQLEKQWNLVRHTEPAKVRKEAGGILDAMGVPAMREVMEPTRVTNKLVPKGRESSSLEGSLPRVQRAFDMVMDPKFDQDLLSLHHLALGLNRLHAGAKILKSGKAKSADAAIVQMEDAVRLHMKKIDPEFARVSLEYSQKMRLLEQIATILSGTSDNSETKITKVLQSLRETASADVRRDLLKMVKVATGKHIAEMAAGAALSTWTPSGIHARAIALTALPILGGAAFLDGRFILAMPALALTMPRFWAEFAPAIGVPIKTVRKIEEWSGKLRASIPENLLDTSVDIGTIVNRMLEEGIEPPPFPDIGEPVK